MNYYGVFILRNFGISSESDVLLLAGNFSAPKAQEILIARGKILELLRPDENGKVQSILSCEIFGLVRALIPFRLTGT